MGPVKKGVSEDGKLENDLEQSFNPKHNLASNGVSLQFGLLARDKALLDQHQLPIPLHELQDLSLVHVVAEHSLLGLLLVQASARPHHVDQLQMHCVLAGFLDQKGQILRYSFKLGRQNLLDHIGLNKVAHIFLDCSLELAEIRLLEQRKEGTRLC